MSALMKRPRELSLLPASEDTTGGRGSQNHEGTLTRLRICGTRTLAIQRPDCERQALLSMSHPVCGVFVKAAQTD